MTAPVSRRRSTRGRRFAVRRAERRDGFVSKQAEGRLPQKKTRSSISWFHMWRQRRACYAEGPRPRRVRRTRAGPWRRRSRGASLSIVGYRSVSRNRYPTVCTLIAQAVGAEVAHPLRHSPRPRGRRTSRGRDHLEHLARATLMKTYGGIASNGRSRGRPTALPRGRVDDEVDRIARPRAEARKRVGEEEDVRRLRCVA